MYICYLDESGTTARTGNTLYFVLLGFAIPAVTGVACQPAVDGGQASSNVAAKGPEALAECPRAFLDSLQAAAVDSGGLGPLRVGMSRAALKLRCGALGDSTASDEMGGTRTLTPVPVAGVTRAIAEWTGPGGDPARILVVDSTIATHGGIRVGRSMREIRAAHHRLSAGYGEEGVFVWPVDEPGISYLTNFRASEVLSSAEAVDGHPELVPDSARICMIVVSKAE